MKKVSTIINVTISFFCIGGLILVEGCGIQMPVKDNSYETTDISWEAEAGAGIDLANYRFDLGETLQTTPVHEDDQEESEDSDEEETEESATTDLHKGASVLLRLRLEGGVEIKQNISVHTGMDIRYDVIDLKADDYQEGFYDLERQPLSEEYNSYAFTQLTSSLSYVPFIKIEAKLSEQLKLGGELGFPYNGFTFRSGHDRNGSWETVQKDTWNGWGLSVGGNIGFCLDEDNVFALHFRHERYKPEFLGEQTEIKTYILFVNLERW